MYRSRAFVANDLLVLRLNPFLSTKLYGNPSIPMTSWLGIFRLQNEIPVYCKYYILMNKCFSDRICLLCLFDFNSFCISYYWMISPNKKFYIWKDWQIFLVFNWFCTDRASERITDCLTCSWALLFCWEMLLINFSLLGVFVLIVICCCFYILYAF